MIYTSANKPKWWNWQTRWIHHESERSSIYDAMNRALLWFMAKSIIVKSMYYVYILKSLLDDKLYIGRTSTLQKRLNQHKNGLVRSTKNRRPLVIIFYEAYKNKSDSIRREKYFKTTKGKNHYT